jgi:hypothetical protein
VCGYTLHDLFNGRADQDFAQFRAQGHDVLAFSADVEAHGFLHRAVGFIKSIRELPLRKTVPVCTA